MIASAEYYCIIHIGNFIPVTKDHCGNLHYLLHRICQKTSQNTKKSFHLIPYKLNGLLFGLKVFCFKLDNINL